MKQLIWKITFVITLFSCSEDGPNGITLGPGNGIGGVGGSTALFVVNGDHLYIADDSELKILKIESDKEAQLVNSVPQIAEIESILIFDNYLFIGVGFSLNVYNLRNPVILELETVFWNELSCNPVIAQGNFAYLTVSDGSACATGRNQLITVDITDISNIAGVDTIEMIRPGGLAFYEGDLYVSEGAFGTKRFDISTPYNPQLDTLYSDILSNDLIGLSDALIVIENIGVSQFALENDSLKLLSRIR